MLKATIASLKAHKLRLVATCLAVVLGVAFMTGTNVLSATVNRVFDDLFGTLGENTDAIVRGEELFSSQFTGTQRALLDESVVDTVAEVPGVAFAEGSISTVQLTLLDADGEPMGGFGPPTVVGAWNVDEQMAAYQVDEGRAPDAPGEAIIDRAGVEAAGYEVGDTVTLITPSGNVELELVGTSKFGAADSAGGSIFVGTTLAQAQELTGEAGKVDTISVRADEGVTPDEVVTAIERADVAEGVDVVTGAEAADEAASEVQEGFSFFSTMLLIFALIALFVGWFIISNIFGILVAQRTKELALLRAIGAGRSQVLGSVLLEATIVGVISSLVGLLGGVALAFVALYGLAAIGVDLPQADLVITPGIVLGALIAGFGITVVAALGPAIKATRVPPIAALRDVAIDRAGRSWIRTGLGLLLLLAGLASISPAFGTDPSSETIPGVGFGLALILLAVLTLGPIIAGPVARLVGSPLPLIAGITGKLARQNAVRSPRRTASTAAAIIIGVALISFITAFAQSAKASVNDAIGSNFTGDFVVVPINQFSFAGVSPDLRTSLADLDGVDVVTGFGVLPAELVLPNGDKPTGVVGGIDPATFGDLFEIEMADGELTDLTDQGIVVDRAVARDADLAIGDQITITAPGGRSGTFTIESISDDPALLGQWTLTNAAVTALSPQPADFQLGIKLTEGADLETVRAEIKTVLEDYPTMKVQDRDEFASGIANSINALLNVIYALLVVSVIIAFIGIINTLSLSIHERTRELGLLRAVGMTRSQIRRSVWLEAGIVTVMGTAIGMALGLALCWVMVKALVSQGITTYEVPVVGLPSMSVILVVALILGVAASVWPAYKASKLNVLDAIATE